MNRSRLVSGIAVVTAVAAGGIGGALIAVPSLSGAQSFAKSVNVGAATDAATSPGGPAGKAGPTRPGSPLIDAAAKALHLTPQQLLTKLSDAKTTIADVAKQQKVDINAVIDAMTSADRDRITKIVNSPFARPKPGGAAKGPANGPVGVPGIRGGFGRFGAMTALGPVASALGITPQALQADLAKGQTIAQIAKAKNIDVNTIINKLVGDADAKIDQALKDKHLTQAQADKAKAAVKTAITNLVNNGFPKGPRPGIGGGFGFPGRGGAGGPGPGSKPPTP